MAAGNPPHRLAAITGLREMTKQAPQFKGAHHPHWVVGYLKVSPAMAAGVNDEGFATEGEAGRWIKKSIRSVAERTKG
jgi:hypothetical protein